MLDKLAIAKIWYLKKYRFGGYKCFGQNTTPFGKNSRNSDQGKVIEKGKPSITPIFVEVVNACLIKNLTARSRLCREKNCWKYHHFEEYQSTWSVVGRPPVHMEIIAAKESPGRNESAASRKSGYLGMKLSGTSATIRGEENPGNWSFPTNGFLRANAWSTWIGLCCGEAGAATLT